MSPHYIHDPERNRLCTKSPCFSTDSSAKLSAGMVLARRILMIRTTLVPIAILLCIFVCGVTGAVPAAAATYHVMKTGSDSNSCSSGAPCLTIARGLNMLSAGDTLVIHAGTYAENNLQPPGGRAGAPVTVMGVTDETVTIRPTSNVAPGFSLSQSKAFITIKNLKIDGNEFVSYGIHIEAADVAIEDVEIAYPRNQGVALYRQPHGTSQRVTLRNLNVHHTGQGTSGCNGTTPKPGYCHGVYMQTSDNVIDGGSFHHCNGYGLQIYPYGNLTMSH